MMKEMKAGRVLLSFLLSLAMVIGFMPGMGITAHAEPTEKLLTTITGTGANGTATSENISYSTGGVATLTFSGEVLYASIWGWWGYNITLTVTPADGYTVTRCVFYDNKDNNATDCEAPFVAETVGDEQKMPKVNGDYIYPYSDSAGVKKIEVYGYANPTNVDVTGVSLNKTTTTLTVGDTETLTATVNPGDASNKSVTWSSDNTSVATVDANGLVKAVDAGTANITATTTDGSKTASCAVTVIATSSGGDSSDSGNSGSSDSGSTSGGNSDSGSSSGSSSSSSSSTSTSTPAPTTVPYDDVPISTGSVNDITGTASATAESNPFETKVENNDNLTTLLELTSEEVAQGVNVWLDIQDMSSTVPQAEKDIVQNASANYTVGIYLDINLFKKVGGNTATKVTETNGTVKASILIPESLWKAGRTFEIIRVHDGEATAIEGTYDENTHVFTFETDKFSTYALAYKDQASLSDSDTTSDSSSPNSSNSTQPTAPETGDPNDVRVWYLLLLASLGGLGFFGYSKKKKAND